MLPEMVLKRIRNMLGARRAREIEYRLVAHRPVRSALMKLLVGVVVIAAAALGYWLGVSKGQLDRVYLAALENRQQAQRARLETLGRELADVQLAQSIDAQAAAMLRETIRDLRGEAAGLREEVTFYKSLMAPSSMDRGLQIAEFGLSEGPGEGEFAYRILLTQTAEQRSWISGEVHVEVEGVRAAADGASVEEVLSLTEVADIENYPLRFRFRYFQDFSGMVTLPDGFRPRLVRVTATPGGRSSDVAQREYDWFVQP
jgi:hypothetical protein